MIVCFAKVVPMVFAGAACPAKSGGFLIPVGKTRGYIDLTALNTHRFVDSCVL